MARSAEDDWPENQRIAPGASQSNELRHCARVEAQFQVFAGLRVTNVELIAEPVPDRLLELIREFEATRVLRHDS